MQHKPKLDWVNTIFLTLTPVLAIIGSYYHFKIEGPSLTVFVIAIIFYYLTGLSITAGYHRLLSHQSYKAHPLLKFFFLFFGAGAFQNSALKWCRDHRIHHQHCDKKDDPYNIKKGFLHAHIGWVFYQETNTDFSNVRDLSRDPMIRLQDRRIFMIGGFSGIILPIIIGFLIGYPIGGFAIIAMARIVVVHHMTFFINSLCHMIGKENYDGQSTAKDSFWMAFFTFGEGFHNFHHTFQADYRNGIAWYHYDPTKWLIKGLSLFNLAFNLKKVDDATILESKFEAKAQKFNQINLAASGALKKSYQKLKIDFSCNLKRYRQEKLLFQKNSLKLKRKELKVRLNKSRKELLKSFKTWDRFADGATLCPN